MQTTALTQEEAEEMDAERIILLAAAFDGLPAHADHYHVPYVPQESPDFMITETY